MGFLEDEAQADAHPEGFWPLAEDAEPCVGSGLCCKTGRCSIGAMKHGPGRDCPSLVERDGRHYCGEILNASPEEAARLRRHLYIGAGCCMTVGNRARQEIISRDRLVKERSDG